MKKRPLIIRAVVLVAVLGLLGTLATAASRLDSRSISEGDAPAGGGSGGNPHLEETDLNEGEPPGRVWSGVGPKGDNQRVPFTSDFASAVSFRCDPDGEGAEPAVTAPPPPFAPDTDVLGGAFRRKDTAAEGGAQARGNSKLLAQRILKYANEPGEDGISGQEKAAAVLAYFTTLVNTPGCTWETQDPGVVDNSTDPPTQGPTRSRSWSITPEPDPGLGGGPSNSLHFRVSSTLGSGENQTPVVNDVVIIKRGRSLNVMMMTSPGAESPEEAAANKNEAKQKGGKADNKVKDHGNGGNF